MTHHELQPLPHVALAGIGLLGVVPEVGALKQAPHDLTEGKHAHGGVIIKPAYEEALHIRLAAAGHPLLECPGIGRRRDPAAMKRSAGTVPSHDLRLVAVRWLAEVDSFTNFEGIL